VGIEINKEYCCWAEKRLAQADIDMSIQGYAGGVFWERNSLALQQAALGKKAQREKRDVSVKELFAGVSQ